MDEVRRPAGCCDHLDRVTLDESERVPGLWRKIDPCYIRPRQVVAHAGAALAAVHIQYAHGLSFLRVPDEPDN